MNEVITFEEAYGWFQEGTPLDLYSLHENPASLSRPRGSEHVAREVLYACYEQEDYQGSAFVLYCENGKLYEVHGSHCSCNGLEGQWSPEEVTLEELLHRLKKGHLRSWSGVEEVLRRLKSD